MKQIIKLKQQPLSSLEKEVIDNISNLQNLLDKAKDFYCYDKALEEANTSLDYAISNIEYLIEKEKEQESEDEEFGNKYGFYFEDSTKEQND